ncbi:MULTISPECIES: hypothetical protein [unclassified Bacillus (in: firmicutes)]|nr:MULTISPECIES: hypothetical protein [unclassified Bacillus (in: firmicutes)]
MADKRKKSPYLLDKPSTAPKRDRSNSQLMKLNEKMKENIHKLKKSR